MFGPFRAIHIKAVQAAKAFQLWRGIRSGNPALPTNPLCKIVFQDKHIGTDARVKTVVCNDIIAAVMGDARYNQQKVICVVKYVN
jgi:hypothetical protein